MKNIQVNTQKRYEIKIEEGLITKSKFTAGFVISDSNIAQKYPGLISVNNFVIPAGESSKSLDNYKKILETLGKTNETKILALGGGVVGDLTGFIASTYKRGIPLIQVPTSLLAMVDSSIGGKNGINLGDRKNYIGTIYQPEAVLIDPIFLKTLPEKEFRNGVAEIIKYSAVFDKPKLYELEKRIQNEIVNIILECCEVKSQVVEKDEFNLGYRNVLNFGHTIGHAIELLYGLSHGEAISIGMIKELEIAIKKNISDKKKLDRVKKLLEYFNLPTKLPENADIEKIIELIKADKKGKFIFALDEQNPNIYVSEEDVREALK